MKDSVRKQIRNIAIRRFVAKSIDIIILFVLINLLRVILPSGYGAFLHNVVSDSFFGLVGLTLMLTFIVDIVVTSILHVKFGTTLGKKICGLSIENESGEKISYAKSFKASLHNFIFTFGVGIWFVMPFTLYYNWLSFRNIATLPNDAKLKIYSGFIDLTFNRVMVIIGSVIFTLSLAIYFGGHLNKISQDIYSPDRVKRAVKILLTQEFAQNHVSRINRIEKEYGDKVKELNKNPLSPKNIKDLGEIKKNISRMEQLIMFNTQRIKTRQNIMQEYIQDIEIYANSNPDMLPLKNDVITKIRTAHDKVFHLIAVDDRLYNKMRDLLIYLADNYDEMKINEEKSLIYYDDNLKTGYVAKKIKDINDILSLYDARKR